MLLIKHEDEFPNHNKLFESRIVGRVVDIDVGQECCSIGQPELAGDWTRLCDSSFWVTSPWAISQITFLHQKRLWYSLAKQYVTQVKGFTGHAQLLYTFGSRPWCTQCTDGTSPLSQKLKFGAHDGGCFLEKSEHITFVCMSSHHKCYLYTTFRIINATSKEQLACQHFFPLMLEFRTLYLQRVGSAMTRISENRCIGLSFAQFNSPQIEISGDSQQHICRKQL